MTNITLKDLPHLTAQAECISDLELKAAYKRAILHCLHTDQAEHKQRAFAYFGVVGGMIFFLFVTGIIAILATLKLITVDDKYLTMTWGAFVIDTIALGQWLVKQKASGKNPG